MDIYYSEYDIFTIIDINEPTLVKANFAFTQINVLHYDRQKVLVIIKLTFSSQKLF